MVFGAAHVHCLLLIFYKFTYFCCWSLMAKSNKHGGNHEIWLGDGYKQLVKIHHGKPGTGWSLFKWLSSVKYGVLEEVRAWFLMKLVLRYKWKVSKSLLDLAEGDSHRRHFLRDDICVYLLGLLCRILTKKWFMLAQTLPCLVPLARIQASCPANFPLDKK